MSSWKIPWSEWALYGSWPCFYPGGILYNHLLHAENQQMFTFPSQKVIWQHNCFCLLICSCMRLKLSKKHQLADLVLLLLCHKGRIHDLGISLATTGVQAWAACVPCASRPRDRYPEYPLQAIYQENWQLSGEMVVLLSSAGFWDQMSLWIVTGPSISTVYSGLQSMWSCLNCTLLCTEGCVLIWSVTFLRKDFLALWLLCSSSSNLWTRGSRQRKRWKWL